MNPWSFISLLLLRSVLPGEEESTAVPETSFLVISDTHYYDPALGTAG
jgi:hypothetical protein